jgi:hypothetical protein
LEKIIEIEPWATWVRRRYPQLYPQFEQKRYDLRTLVDATEGKPNLMSQLCEVLRKG